jgi:hypothetical protein
MANSRTIILFVCVGAGWLFSKKHGEKLSSKSGNYMSRTALAGVTILCGLVLLSFTYHSSFEGQHVVSLISRAAGFQNTEMLSSFRSDLAHPYNSMRPANDIFVNPYNMRTQSVNPEPLHPYNNGKRPKAVLHREFEHNPYGNHLPWETGPAGALAKDIKRPDKYESSLQTHSWTLLILSVVQVTGVQVCCESRRRSAKVGLRPTQDRASAGADYSRDH